jgi:hypothetical protein
MTTDEPRVVRLEGEALPVSCRPTVVVAAGNLDHQTS